MAAIFTAVLGSEVLQIAYERPEDTLSHEDAQSGRREPDERPAKLVEATRIG